MNFQVYTTKKVEFNQHLAKMKVLNEDNNNHNNTSSSNSINYNNNTDTSDASEKTIFIDRLVKLALEDKIFTDDNVCDELKTVLLAVRIELARNRLLNFGAQIWQFTIAIVSRS